MKFFQKKNLKGVPVRKPKISENLAKRVARGGGKFSSMAQKFLNFLGFLREKFKKILVLIFL